MPRLDRHPRLGLRDAPVGEVEIGIVAAGDPGVAAGARHVGQRAPGIAAGLAGARDGVELPQLLAGLGVVGADEAALLRLKRSQPPRPWITLPLATIGPLELVKPLRGSATGVSHAILPVRASSATSWPSLVAMKILSS